MAEQQTLDTLVIKVVSDTTNAQEGLTKLADTLERIKGISSGGKGFSNIQKNIDAITASMSKVESGGILKLKYLSQSLKALGEVKISKTIPDRLTAIGEAVDLLKSVDTSKFTEISQGMQTLSSVGNVRISGAGATKGASPAAKDESSWVAMNKRTGEFVADTAATLNKGKALFADFADKAHSAFGNVGLAVLKLNAEMRKFFDAHNLSLRRFGSDIGKFLTAPFRKAQSVVKAFTGKFSNFFAMFKKRAMYRAINGIISAITDGFKTGTDNLYQYSKAISGPFADSMDRIATTLLYFKNSIGAAVGPLINMLAPAIEFCTDKAVEFLNTINQLFARLSGASSWTKAIRYPKEYAEAADDATKANEELKKTILGFDQLNVLQDNSKKDSKSGKQADDYSKMFEEVALTAAKSPFEGFFTPFKKAWENEGENTLNAIRTAFDQVKGLIDSVKKSFETVWQNGTGQQTIETILRIWQDIFGIIGNVAEKLKEAWEKNDTGTRIVQAIWDIVNSILGTIEKILEKTKEWAENLNFSPFLEAAANLFEKIKPLVDILGDALAWLWENVVLPAAKWVIEKGAPDIIDALSGITEFLTGVFSGDWELAWQGICDFTKGIWKLVWEDTLEPIVDWIYREILTPIGRYFSEKFEEIKKSVTDAWDGIKQSWKDAKDWFHDNITQPIADFFSDVWNGITKAASDCWDAIVEFFSPAIEWFEKLFGSIWKTISDIFYDIGVIASGCWEVIKKVWEIVSKWFDDNVVKPVAKFFKDLWESIKDKAEKAWSNIQKAFSPVAQWFSRTIIQPLTNFFRDLWKGFSDKGSEAWEATKRVFSRVSEFFRETFEKAWRGIVNVFSVGGEIFINIKDGVLSAFKWVVNQLINGINNVVAVPFRGINDVIGWLRNISIVGLTPFSGLRDINIPQIPTLAQGGMVPNNGTMFIAGEAGAEVVANIGNRTGVMNTDQMQKSVEQGILNATGSIANAVAAAVAKSGQNGIAPTVEVTVKADSETLYKTVKKGEKYFNNRYHVVVGV